MRGRIIHYNGNDGRGLIATDNRQLPFEIAHWRSDTAPVVNVVVELSMAGDALEAVTRVPDDVLLKEKAGQLASKLGTAGGAALQSLKDAAPPNTSASATGGWQLLGKPLLIAHGVFAFSALMLPFLSIALPVFWRNRLAWLALLLPLFASLKPGIDLALAAAKATRGLNDSFESQLQRQIVEQLLEALQIGFGAWVCVLAALVVAAFGLKRVLLPPTA